MKIYLITSNPQISDAMENELRGLGNVSVINAQKMTAEQVIDKAGDAEILIAGPSGIEKISKELLLGLGRIKLIAALTVGVWWIDLKAANELGVIVSNIKGANAESVAEHTWALILDLAKRVTEFDRDVRNKGAFKFSEYTGKEIYGKTLGILGLGDTGSKVARIASGFDMRILGYNRSKKIITGMEQVDLETLLKESDVIVTCLPLTEETKNIISESEVSQMKDGVILVNPSIEGIIDPHAILKGLKSGKIFGFGIETDIMKPVPSDSPYLKHPRIIINVHNAFNTEDANRKSYDSAIANVRAFVEGKPQNVVN